LPSAPDFLASVPIFARLSDELREEVAARSQRLDVSAGHWLFRQGDAADALYVILTGRLEILTEAQGRLTAVRELARGSALGELALLTDMPRSASVRALRDSDLLVVSRETFQAVLGSEPDFARALITALGRQLQDRSAATGRRRVPATVVLVALDPGAPLPAVRDALEVTLAEQATVACLSGVESVLPEDHGSSGVFGGALDRVEAENEHVLLSARSPEAGDPWTRFCLRQADRVVCVATGPPAAWLTAPGGGPPVLAGKAAVQGCELVLAGTDGTDELLAAWRDAAAPRSVRLTGPEPGRADLARLARRIGGRSVGVVLSGGGARGFAHIGALGALIDAGVEIDRVAGCSMGAYVGAQFSMGRSATEIHDRCREEFVAANPLNDYTVPLAALVRGRKARAMLERTFAGELVERLDRDYFCVACDLVRAELVVLRSGPLGQAVGASMCLPGITPPVAVGERLLVDGGVFNNLPVEEMAVSNEGPVLAIDVTAQFESPGARAPRWRRRRPREIAARGRQAITGWDTPLPSFKETIIRSIVLGSIDTAAAAAQYADALIVPAVEEFGLLDFAALDRIVDAGSAAATAALESQALAGVAA
jgi:NTE family protein